MNYQKIYDNLIQSAQLRPDISFLNGYTERHHILPKSMGGNDDASNLVRLTAREHFVAHHLLWRIHRSEALAYAFWCMCFQKTNGRDYKVNSRFYEKARKEAVSYISEHAKKRIGLKNPFYGKRHSEETRRKISEANKGKKMPDSFIQKLKEKTGSKNPNYGKKHNFPKPVTDLLEKNKEDIIHMYTNGMLSREIAKKYNCEATVVLKFLKNNNVPKYRMQNYDDFYKDYISGKYNYKELCSKYPFVSKTKVNYRVSRYEKLNNLDKKRFKKSKEECKNILNSNMNYILECRRNGMTFEQIAKAINIGLSSLLIFKQENGIK